MCSTAAPWASAARLTLCSRMNRWLSDPRTSAIFWEHRLKSYVYAAMQHGRGVPPRSVLGREAPDWSGSRNRPMTSSKYRPCCRAAHIAIAFESPSCGLCGGDLIKHHAMSSNRQRPSLLPSLCACLGLAAVHLPVHAQFYGGWGQQQPQSGYGRCRGYNGPGGPCYDGPGGPLYTGPGGPCYAGPGGPCYSGPGGDGRGCRPDCP